MMIDIVIVEDDKNSADSLSLILDNIEETRVLAKASTVAEAVKAIDKLKPSLIFLDVMLCDGNGFDVLKQIKHYKYQVVFTTSYAEYAIRAFELSALHYLLKPIAVGMIEDVIKRFDNYSEIFNHHNMLKVAENSFHNKIDKIILRTNSGNEVFLLKDIVRIEAEQNYSNVILSNSTSILISKNIQHFEKLLGEFGFCRVHNSYLINIDQIKKIQKGRVQTVTLSDGYEIRISDSKRQSMQELISERILQG